MKILIGTLLVLSLSSISSQVFAGAGANLPPGVYGGKTMVITVDEKGALDVDLLPCNHARFDSATLDSKESFVTKGKMQTLLQTREKQSVDVILSGWMVKPGTYSVALTEPGTKVFFNGMVTLGEQKQVFNCKSMGR